MMHGNSNIKCLDELYLYLGKEWTKMTYLLCALFVTKKKKLRGCTSSYAVPSRLLTSRKLNDMQGQGGDMIKIPDDGLRLELFSLFYIRMKLGVPRNVKDKD